MTNLVLDLIKNDPKSKFLLGKFVCINSLEVQRRTAPEPMD